MSTTRHILKFRPQTTTLLGRGVINGGLTRTFIHSSLFRPMPAVGIQQCSIWNGRLTSPLKRGLTLAVIGGTSLLGLVVLGPFILIGVGGITAVVAFRFWRFKKQFLQSGSDWPGFLNEFFQNQQVFGKEKIKVESEAIQKLKSWTQTEQGRHCLIEHGIHPERIIENVSMRGSSFTLINNSKEIKIELDLGSSPRSVLIALAEIDVEGNISLTDIKLVTSAGNIINVPLQQNGGGRVIEGEFRDV